MMKLKTQFIAGMVIFSAIVLIIAVSVINTNNQITQLNVQIEIARSIERETAQLGYLSNDYFLYQESQQLSTWQSKLASISSDIETLLPTSEQEHTQVANLNDDILRMNTVFNEVVIYLNNAPRNVSIRIDPAFQTSWSRMAVQTQTLSFDASQLSQVLIGQANQAQQTNTLLIITLFVVFWVYFLTNYVIIYRRALKSISELQSGAGIIGSGNFDFTIPEKTDDEIGELSHAFNNMTANLKQVTASKTELEREVSERKKAEELLNRSNGELVVKEEALRTSNEQVQEYANRLERIVDETTEALRESEAKLRRVQQVDTVSRIGATVAHDLRGPLNIISQSLEVAEKEPGLTPNMLAYARRSTEKALNMVEAFRAGTREVKVVKRAVDLSTLVNDVVDGLPKKKNIQVDVEIGEGFEAVPLDLEIMSRVLDNLGRNAIEAMPEGGQLSISVSRIGEEANIQVKDTGIGIKPENTIHLFEPLFTTKSGGMGLGLYFVRTAVEAHGGSISVESEEGLGTKFRIKIPIT
jgi:signal transduction histidine kinase